MNNVVLIGRLTTKPEVRIHNNVTYVNANIAVDRDFKGKDGKTETDFINISAMGKTAEFFVNYLDKGRLICVQGSIRVDKYENKEGQKMTSTKVAVNRVKALDRKKDTTNNNQNNNNENVASGVQDGLSSEASFEPIGLDPQGFQAIDDDDIPF